MRRWQEILILVFVDSVASVAALGAALWVRNAATSDGLSFPLGAYVVPAALLALGWVGLFAYVGLYGEWSTKSRLGELGWIVKVVFFGGIVLFLLTFDPERPFPLSRIVLLSYGLTLVAVSGAGRLSVRGIQRHLFARGSGLRNALIVGTGRRAKELASTMARFPRLGLRVVGYVSPASSEEDEAVQPVLGALAELRKVVVGSRAAEVIFADPMLSHETVLNAVAGLEGVKVNISIVPDLYDVVTGHSGLGQIYGMPLMPLFPSTMLVWQRRTKRLLDVVAAVSVFFLALPFWILVAFAVWLEDRGPVFYSQERVGKEGRIFRVYKFRSMIPDAEKHSGPVWAAKDDPRITRVGRVIRKLRLDELPQIWNILRGEMSLVGPRPERPFFVERLAAEIPLYRRRLYVTPGLTGWAQTKQAYDATLDDVREKLKYDLYYIENMSLSFDLLILLRTVWVVLTGKGAQ